MKKRFFLYSILLMTGMVAIFFACSKSSYNNSGSGGGGGGNPTNTIYMKNSVYSSPALTVIIGSKVTWVNDDNMIHTVTSDNGTFDSGDMNPGSSFNYTFNATGTFSYHCVHHSNMTGVVTVVTQY
jgi:plastocyanin